MTTPILLTPRQSEIIALKIKGATCGEISKQLGVSLTTARKQMQNARDVNGARNNDQLIYWYAKRGYVVRDLRGKGALIGRYAP